MKSIERRVVWLAQDFRASFWNTLITAPMVAVTLVCTWPYPDVRILAGVMLGLWLGGLHNVVWGWLSTKRYPNRQH